MSRQRIIRINQDRLRRGATPLIVNRSGNGDIDYSCRHLVEFDQHVPCGCPRKSVAAFECTLHGLCTIRVKATDPKIPFCETCPEFAVRSG